MGWFDRKHPGGRPRLDPAIKRSRRTVIYLNEDEWGTLESLCQETGTQRGAFLRSLMLRAATLRRTKMGA